MFAVSYNLCSCIVLYRRDYFGKVCLHVVEALLVCTRHYIIQVRGYEYFMLCILYATVNHLTYRAHLS